MNLNYCQSTGKITDDEGNFIASGWAGHGEGKNEPSMQEVHCIGPLPQGVYQVGNWEDVHPGLGPDVASLEQIEGKTFGRDAFYIHGPAKDPDHYGQESKGCIVVPRLGRLAIKALAPDTIKVFV